jgi:hypothetical protein
MELYIDREKAVVEVRLIRPGKYGFNDMESELELPRTHSYWFGLYILWPTILKSTRYHQDQGLQILY